LAVRLEKAGAAHVKVRPGKKAQFSISFSSLDGWDPARDAAIEEGDAIPEKPWLVFSLGRFTNPGREQVPSFTLVPLVFVTHHVLSRAAQRLGGKTIKELEAWSVSLFGTGMDIVLEVGRENLNQLPVFGRRAISQLDENTKATVVFKKHESRSALVATTIF
jgi:hypothetical protein